MKIFGITLFIMINLEAAGLFCSLYADEGKELPKITAPVIAFCHVNIVPMTEETVIEDQTVLIKGGRILKAGPSGRIVLPEGAALIDGKGAFLMPGLSDMHIHTRLNWQQADNDWRVSPADLYIVNGVTTIRCLGPKGGDQKYALRWKEKIERGEMIGPQLFAAGPTLYGPLNDAEEIVSEQVSAGFDCIKMYSYLSRSEFHDAATTARQAGAYAVGHIPFQVGLDGVLSEHGLDEIAHIEELAWELFLFDRQKKFKGKKWLTYVTEMAYKQYKEVYAAYSDEKLKAHFGSRMALMAEKIRAADISVCTTLFLDEVIVDKLHFPEKFLSNPLNIYLPGQYLNAFRNGKEKHQVMFRGGEDFACFKQKLDLLLLEHLKKAGVRMILGTDSGTGWMGMVPGYSIHDELRILTENGFSPYEAILTGTVNASLVVKRMNGSGNFGTIEAGKRADLILIKANPLTDISALKKISGVMVSGTWFDSKALKQLLN